MRRPHHVNHTGHASDVSRASHIKFVPYMSLVVLLTAAMGTAWAAPEPSAAHHWNHLPAAHRDHLLTQYHHLQHLDPHQQRVLHRKLQWFDTLPPAEQARLRQLWQHLSLAERKQWAQRFEQTPVAMQPRLRAQLLSQLDQRHRAAVGATTTTHE